MSFSHICIVYVADLINEVQILYVGPCLENSSAVLHVCRRVTIMDLSHLAWWLMGELAASALFRRRRIWRWKGFWPLSLPRAAGEGKLGGNGPWHGSAASRRDLVEAEVTPRWRYSTCQCLQEFALVWSFPLSFHITSPDDCRAQVVFAVVRRVVITRPGACSLHLLWENGSISIWTSKYGCLRAATVFCF